MSIIKKLNDELNETLSQTKALTEVVANNGAILGESIETLTESAEGFLGVIAARLTAGHDIDPKSNDTRNMFGILAALDLLRFPQARKAVDSNSIRAYLDIIKGVDKDSSLNQVEIKLLHNLENMKNTEGESGMSIRDHYLELLRTDRPTLLGDIGKLKNQYTQITSKLQSAMQQQAAQPSTI